MRNQNKFNSPFKMLNYVLSEKKGICYLLRTDEKGNFTFSGQFGVNRVVEDAFFYEITNRKYLFQLLDYLRVIKYRDDQLFRNDGDNLLGGLCKLEINYDSYQGLDLQDEMNNYAN